MSKTKEDCKVKFEQNINFKGFRADPVFDNTRTLEACATKFNAQELAKAWAQPVPTYDYRNINIVVNVTAATASLEQMKIAFAKTADFAKANRIKAAEALLADRAKATFYAKEGKSTPELSMFDKARATLKNKHRS